MSGKKDRNADKRMEKMLRREQEARRKKRLPLIFGGVLVAIALLVTGVTLSESYSQGAEQAAETAKVDFDELYKDKITPKQLDEKIAAKEDFYAYFYQPNCSYCKIVTPILIPMAREMGKPVFPVDISKSKDTWEKFDISGTPTLISFKKGESTDKLVGSQTEEALRDFLTAK